MKTSILEKNIGEHEHNMMIFESYENYAVCKKCGLHDWAWQHGEDFGIEDFKKLYPKRKVIPFT